MFIDGKSDVLREQNPFFFFLSKLSGVSFDSTNTYCLIIYLGPTGVKDNLEFSWQFSLRIFCGLSQAWVWNYCHFAREYKNIMYLCQGWLSQANTDCSGLALSRLFWSLHTWKQEKSCLRGINFLHSSSGLIYVSPKPSLVLAQGCDRPGCMCCIF